MKLSIFFIVILISLVGIQQSYSFEGRYDLTGQLLEQKPIVCILEPTDPSLSQFTKQRKFLDLAKSSVEEWEAMLKNHAGSKRTDVESWDIYTKIIELKDQKELTSSTCGNIIISFEPKPSESDRHFQTLGDTFYYPKTDQFIITIYYLQISDCTEQITEEDNIFFWSIPCYTDELRMTEQLQTTMRHEFGHVLGLGHYYFDDELITEQWSRGKGVAPSVMVEISAENVSDMIITLKDIKKVYSIYDGKGFFHSEELKKLADIDENTIELQDLNTINKVPSWFRNTVEWWLEGSMSDKEFLDSIKYLIKLEIIVP